MSTVPVDTAATTATAQSAVDQQANENESVKDETTAGETSTRPSTNSSEEAVGAEAPVSTEQDEMKRLWRESPFAVGYTRATWSDEKAGCSDVVKACCANSSSTYILCSAFVCRRAGRVGNMVILKQRQEQVEDLAGQIIQRPKIQCVVGPYWFVPLFLTVPFFGGLSFWAGYSKLSDQHIAIVITWALCQMGLFVSLANVSCRDPGILYRHAQPPPTPDGDIEWRWNDQALTYRPQSAKFDPECAVMIDEFDHTCPWTGTAIGRNNMPWFKRFLFFMVAVLMYDIVLLAFI